MELPAHQRTFQSVTTGDDEAQWARAVAGDGDGFGVIFDRYRGRVRRHVHRLVPTHADADDVVAATFLEAWRQRDRVRFVDGSMLPWLLRTATNCARNVTRSTRRYRAMIARLPADTTMPDPTDAMDGGPAIDMLRRLSRTHQEVMALCVLEGLTVDEAAQALGIRPGTVKSRLSRAKGQLRERLADSRSHYRLEWTD